MKKFLEINIRKADMNDLNSIYEIEIEDEDAWTFNMIEEELSSDSISDYFVAERDSEIVGYISVMNVLGEVHVNNIAVKKSFRNMGIGTKLLDYGINYYTDENLIGITLEVREDNFPAIHMYENAGFIQVGKRKRYYKHNKDAYVMWKYSGGN